ncbi:MAG: TetR/AcrR family transcriptional regulator [Actinomycetes bacterium]
MASPHPTKEALIEAVLELLQSEHLVEVTSEEVLEKSGISKGSLYHHFEDFSDLLEQAQVKRFANYVDETSALIVQALQIQNRDLFAEAMREVTRATQGEEMKQQRLYRVKAMAAAGQNDRMRAHYAIEQERLTSALADLFREVIARGWGNPRLDPLTLAVFIQAYTMGQVVNDYVETKMEPANWLWLIDSIVDNVMLNPELA